MNKFKIVPLSKQYAANIRSTMKDDFNHYVLEQVATGKGPCRVSLQPFEPGKDRRLVLTHSPFLTDNVYNQPGPVFINQQEVEEYADICHFPPAIKADKINFPLSLIGYDTNQLMVYARLVGDKDVDELINRIFDKHPEVVFLHARNAAACCFICKIERR
jgi:Protein of unknown function (DUF1203)